MKKKNLILVAMATALLATSCAEEQQFGGAISNSAIALHPTIGKVGTRATETTTANLHAFRAYSFLTDDNVNYMDGVTYSNSSGDWNTSAGSFYWPVKGELNFYCYEPETPGKTGTFAIDPSSQKLTGFAPFPTAAQQQDLVYAKATGSLAANVTSGLDVNFSHALSEITIAAKNTNTAYTVEVFGVKLGNVISEGDFTFPSVAGSDASWSLGTERSDYTTEWQNATTLSSTISSLDASNTAFMLLPQQLSAQAKAIEGNYIALKVRITMQGGQVVHDGWAYVAIPTLWEMNKHYAYMLDFSEGAGQDENGNDIISGSGIKFNVTVTPWDEENIKLLRKYISGINSTNDVFPLFLNGKPYPVTPNENGSWEYDVTDMELTNLTGLLGNYSQNTVTFIDLSHLEMDNITSAIALFANCSNLRKIDFGQWNVAGCISIANMFTSCRSLEELDLSQWNTNKAQYMDNMFAGTKFSRLNLSGWTINSKVNYMFAGSEIENLNLSNWVINATDISQLFRDVNEKNIKVSGWDTHKVTNMSQMFYNCPNLTELEVKDWNVSNVTNMEDMFYGCKSLENLNISEWNVNKVKNMNNMFLGCTSFKGTIDLSHWKTDNLVQIAGLFNGCTNITCINLSNWNVTNILYTAGMFENCSSLETLDLSGWKLPKHYNGTSWFGGCSKLKTIYMVGCDEETIDKVKFELKYANLAEDIIKTTR